MLGGRIYAVKEIRRLTKWLIDAGSDLSRIISMVYLRFHQNKQYIETMTCNIGTTVPAVTLLRRIVKFGLHGVYAVFTTR